jgi:hypothetical protein
MFKLNNFFYQNMVLSAVSKVANFLTHNSLLIGAVGGAELYGYEKLRAQNDRLKNPEHWIKSYHLSNPSVYHNASAVDRAGFGMDKNASKNQNHYYG